jgi:hypothetical protein
MFVKPPGPRHTATEEADGLSIRIPAWLCGWTVGGVTFIFIWLWQIKGCEVITVSPTAIDTHGCHCPFPTELRCNYTYAQETFHHGQPARGRSGALVLLAPTAI